MNARVYNIVDVSEEPLEKDRNAARLKVYMLMEPFRCHLRGCGNTMSNLQSFDAASNNKIIIRISA